MVQAKQSQKETDKRINLRQLINDNKPIWVENMTGRGYSKKSGDVVFQVGSGDYIDRVIIPPGADPVCITDQVDPDSIRNCRDLFKLTSRKVLKVLDPEYAEEYYVQNESRRKIVNDKIDRRQRGVRETEIIPPEVREQNIEISGMVMDICLKLKGKHLTADGALEKLVENESSLSSDDLNYVLNNSKNKQVKEWAKEKLASFDEKEE